MQAVSLLKAGLQPYFKDYKGGLNRWGDYRIVRPSSAFGARQGRHKAKAYKLCRKRLRQGCCRLQSRLALEEYRAGRNTGRIQPRLERCHEYLQPSRYVDLSPEAWRLAVDATHGEPDLWRAAVAIMRLIFREFRYEPGATHVRTRVDEALAGRRGVCQDFAHVMLAMCRSLGIPALYVSGYLYNGPRELLRGAQASHAWCEVFVPGLGWRGLDPTNDQPADEHYVKVAIGRDYADVAPVQGTFRGTTTQDLTVEVDVQRVLS